MFEKEKVRSEGRKQIRYREDCIQNVMCLQKRPGSMYICAQTGMRTGDLAVPALGNDSLDLDSRPPPPFPPRRKREKRNPPKARQIGITIGVKV